MSEAKGSESQLGDMGGEGKGSVDWAGLMSESVGELGEAMVDEAVVGGQMGFKSRLGDIVE